MTRKNKTLYSRHRILTERIMLGVSGNPLKTKETTQKYMEQMASYQETRNVRGQITHYVTLADITKWNAQVKKRLSKLPT